MHDLMEFGGGETSHEIAVQLSLALTFLGAAEHETKDAGQHDGRRAGERLEEHATKAKANGQERGQKNRTDKICKAARQPRKLHAHPGGNERDDGEEAILCRLKKGEPTITLRQDENCLEKLLKADGATQKPIGEAVEGEQREADHRTDGQTRR